MSNPNIRCPLPPVGADPDSLRQFEGHESPKFRVLPLQPQTGGSTTVEEFASSGGSSSSGGGGSSAFTIVPKTVSVSIATLIGSALVPVTLSQSFQLLYISANQPCCVRLYGSAASRTADIGRAVDAPVPAEVTQGLVIDVVLDTSPYLWQTQNIIGANQDATQGTTGYLNVINPSASPLSGLTVTIGYVPLET